MEREGALSKAASQPLDLSLQATFSYSQTTSSQAKSETYNAGIKLDTLEDRLAGLCMAGWLTDWLVG